MRKRCIFVIALVTGCAPRALPSPPRLADVEAPPPVAVGACDGTKDPLHPLIVEWPATNRAELEASAAHGPVVVSYAGCVLKVLASCRADGAGYAAEATAPTEQHVDIGNVQDLHTLLPLGFATLRARVAEGNHLALSYVTASTRVLKQPPGTLQGSCEGATHYIDGMSLGAFSLQADHDKTDEKSAQVGGARISDSTASTQQIGGSAGELATCHSNVDDPACRSILAISLRRLVGGKPLAVGFGLGLGTPIPLPKVAKLVPEAPANGDITALELYDAALSTDRGTVPAAAKAAAWERLGTRYARRRDEWRRRAEAEHARDAQVAAICPGFRVDRTKLERLRQLDENVLGPSDKEAYDEEFRAAYAPWPELARCMDLQAETATRDGWAALHGANDGMVHVHAGSFVMGSMLAEDHNAPIRSVTLPDFEIDATEITVEEYARCQHAGACSQRGTHAGEDYFRCNTGGESKDQSAANCMTFDQAAAYCHWAHKRLPTEEEWEYAARGPESRRYPWGDWGDNADSRYHWLSYHYCAVPGLDLGYRAGSLEANTSPFGARDMVGGVWEWTTGHYPKASERVLRGGEFGWSNSPDCQPYDAAFRFHHEASYADSNLGGRCVR